MRSPSYGALGRPAFGFANEPALGLIFPPKDYPIPPDAKRLYPAGVEFLGDGVGLAGRHDGRGLRGGDSPRGAGRRRRSPSAGAKVISVFGSSLTFYKGAKFNEELTQRVTKATGLPATTQSNGLVDGLRTVERETHRCAPTAYTDIVTGRLRSSSRSTVSRSRPRKGSASSGFPRARPRRRSCSTWAPRPTPTPARRTRSCVLRRSANARSHRPARESDQGPSGLVHTARADERQCGSSASAPGRRDSGWCSPAPDIVRLPDMDWEARAVLAPGWGRDSTIAHALLDVGGSCSRSISFSAC